MNSATNSGVWLRRQRLNRGWTVRDMCRKLREAASGDYLPSSECLATMIRRWEKGGGVSERYQILFCRVFGIPPEQFGELPEFAPGSEARQPVQVVAVVLFRTAHSPTTPSLSFGQARAGCRVGEDGLSGGGKAEPVPVEDNGVGEDGAQPAVQGAARQRRRRGGGLRP